MALCLGLPYPGELVPEGKTNLDFLEQETVSGIGISWAICKSASYPIQTTMPAPHHSVFAGWTPFLPPNKQHQSTAYAEYFCMSLYAFNCRKYHARQVLCSWV